MVCKAPHRSCIAEVDQGSDPLGSGDDTRIAGYDQSPYQDFRRVRGCTYPEVDESKFCAVQLRFQDHVGSSQVVKDVIEAYSTVMSATSGAIVEIFSEELGANAALAEG